MTIQDYVIILFLCNLILSISTLGGLRDEIFYFVYFKRTYSKRKKFRKEYPLRQRITLSFAKEKAQRYKQTCQHVLLFYHIYCIISIIALIIFILSFIIKQLSILGIFVGVGKLIIFDLPYCIHYSTHTHKTSSIYIRVWDFKKK